MYEIYRSKVMRIMVMDGQGGGVGRSLLEARL